MKFIRIFSIALSTLLLAAHLRWHGFDWLSYPTLVFPFVLFFKRPWAARSVQVFLFLGSLEWIRTTIEIALRRMDDGEPWLRMVIILTSVAVFTAVSALPYFRNRELKRQYGLLKLKDED